MDINQGNLSAVFTGLKATFMEALQTTEQADVNRLLTPVPSSTGTEEYPVATLLGDLEEVIGEVTITNIGKWIQRVPNRTFARIVQVRRNDLADDTIGVYKAGVRRLGVRAALYPLRLAVESLRAGFTDDWVDGKKVFAVDHPWVGGGGTWGNLLSLALDATNFAVAYAAMETMTGPDAAPLGLVPDLLVCGPSNRSAAEAIIDQQFLTGGESNPNFKKVDLMVLARFGSSKAWGLVDTTSGVPMLLQNREGPEFVADESNTSPDAMYKEVYPYKARRRCAVAVVCPWLIQMSTGG